MDHTAGPVGYARICRIVHPGDVVSVARLAGGDAHTAHLHDLVIFAGLAVCVAMMVLVSRMARKTLMQAVTDHETGTNNRQAESASNTA